MDSTLCNAACDEQTDVMKQLDKGGDVNAQGGEYGTALQAGAYSGDTEIVGQLLDKGADIELTDDSGRTPLHVAVEASRLSTVAKLLEKGARANSPDLDGVFPLQYAVQKGDYQIALQLLPKSIDCLGVIKASKWRSLLPGNGIHLEISIHPSPAIKKTPEKHIQNKHYPLTSEIKEITTAVEDFMETDVHSRRIFVLKDGSLLSSLTTGIRYRWWRRVKRQASNDQSLRRKQEDDLTRVWRAQSSTVPSKMVISQIRREDCFVDCCFTTRSIILPTSKDPTWPTLSDDSSLNIQRFEKTHGIVWIMTKCQEGSNLGNVLESRIFFSTSEYAQVPPRATTLLIPLVEQLVDEWKQTFQSAESRLAIKRTELLRSQGENKNLIRELLGDAQLWDLLERACRKQISELIEFLQSYGRSTILHENGPSGIRDVDEDLKKFDVELQGLQKLHDEHLTNLKETSKSLIELEFNLTSIAEAQRSTTTNKSMKRLSWITFVFLPLMFIASLFGMNIDVLSSNPPWWLYLPVAMGTTLLTLIVWLIFKYNRGLEDNIEQTFSRLATWQPGRDLEKGLPPKLPPRQRTARFSAFGKKRS